ncbi:MAG TPA: T9SS type A sorting domain-containing protein [Prolixibacteraceae bacterium]|jgi:hypothetical protein
MKKNNILIFILFLLIGITNFAFSQGLVTVTDCNLNGWVRNAGGNSSLAFMNGPSTPPLGKGSLQFTTPDASFGRLRNTQYTGIPLASVTELSYSTYVQKRDSTVDVNFIVVLVDINGDGSSEHNLVFDPRYQTHPFIKNSMPDQGITQMDVWQNWNALEGGWFFGGELITDPDHEGPYFTLTDYLSQYPNAKINNDPKKGGGAIRLSVGGPAYSPNFIGNADNFKIGINGVTTTYDFEFTTADAGPDKNVIYGYGSNCITLNGSAAGGTAPYTYSWSMGETTSNQASIEVCPTTTTTYQLTVTDAKGCTGMDETTVFVNDVRCGSKMDKVIVCHNGTEICVASPAVQALLQLGDELGSCANTVKSALISQQAMVPSSRLNSYNFPNPFSKTTRIHYEIPSDGQVSITVYDAVGRNIVQLVNSYHKAGFYDVNYDATNLQKGVYYYRVTLKTQKNEFKEAVKKIVRLSSD